MPAFRVIIFSSVAPFEAFRLLERIEKEIPGAQVAGLVYSAASGDSASDPLALPRKHSSAFANLGHALLRFAQASSVDYHDPASMSFDELRAICAQRSWPVLSTAQIHSDEASLFARQQNADLGIALGTDHSDPPAHAAPRHGSISVRRNGAGDHQQACVAVYRAAGKSSATADLCTATFPIEPFDSPGSIALKAGLLGEDLLLDAVRTFAGGAPAANTPTLSSDANPSQEIPAAKSARSATRYERPKWKLLLRSALYLFYLPARNWLRRWRGNFPIVVLYHHLVSDRPHPMGSSTEEFLEHLRYLKRHYRLVSLSEAVAMLRAGKVDQPTAVLTLDDGYADNFLNLRAVLRAEPAPVCLFVCSQLIQRGQAFPHDARDMRTGFPPLSPEQLRKFAGNGVEIGSHTQTHFDCGLNDVPRLQSEIAESRRELERLTGRKITFFSFPWGKHANMCDTAKQIAEENYDFYFSAYGGINFPGRSGKHLQRQAHPYSLWELELTLQNILEFQPAGARDVAPKPVVEVLAAPAGAELVSKEKLNG